MTRQYYEFFSPVKVLAGHQALEHIPFELDMLGCSRPLILTDRGVLGVGLIDMVTDALKASGIDTIEIYSDVPPDSSLETVRKGADFYRENNCDAILAVGGGSVIDTAKGMNILVSEGGDDLRKFAGAHKLKRALKPLFVIPTTSGTGSEATAVAVISDEEKGVKVPFTSNFLMPTATVLDPRMTLTLPAHLTAMTAMDAMTHAVEAYTGTAANPISDSYATAAIKKIAENLPTLMDDLKNADARLELAQASTMAGIAFSNSMVGMVHSIGHSLGAICHLPHGMCMSLMLPYVLEYNSKNNKDCVQRIGELLLPLAGPDVYSSTPSEQRCTKVIAEVRRLRDMLYDHCQLPRTLKETGKVSTDQFKQVATLTVDDGSLVYNRADADVDDVVNVLRHAWE